MTKDGYFVNNGLDLFTYGPNGIKTGNTIDNNKQPRGLMTPIITYSKKNPCISRFSIAYSHHGQMKGDTDTDDYGLTGLYKNLI